MEWTKTTKIIPMYGDKVLTYTPKTNQTEEEYRIILYGSIKSGFPNGVTHWMPLPKPPKQ